MGTPLGADWDIGVTLQPSLPRRPRSPRWLQHSILAYFLHLVKRHSVQFGLLEEVGVGAGLALGERPVVDNLLTAYCQLPTRLVASSKVGCYTSLNSASSLKIADAPHPDAILRFKAPERCPSG